ncbi:hypothetical protein D3C73_1495480 [compost metagenome]
MRGPGVSVGIAGVGSVLGQTEEQEIGSHGQRVSERDVARDMEEWIVGAVDEGCEADGFEFGGA